MQVHSYYYGPTGKNGLDLKTTPQLTQVIDEDTIRKLYTKESKKLVSFSELYKTPHGLVVGVSYIGPTQAHDNRETYANRTFFIKLSDIVHDLQPLLAQEANVHPSFPLKPLNLKLTREG